MEVLAFASEVQDFQDNVAGRAERGRRLRKEKIKTKRPSTFYKIISQLKKSCADCFFLKCLPFALGYHVP